MRLAGSKEFLDNKSNIRGLQKHVMLKVMKVANLAEQENHHPDILVHEWKKVHLTLVTHAIGGLSEDDFILAAKINK